MIRLTKNQKIVVDALNETCPPGVPYEPKNFFKNERLEKAKINMDSLIEILRSLESLRFISKLYVSEVGIPEYLVIEDPVRSYKEFAAMYFAEKAKYAILGAVITIAAEVLVSLLMRIVA